MVSVPPALAASLQKRRDPPQAVHNSITPSSVAGQVRVIVAVVEVATNLYQTSFAAVPEQAAIPEFVAIAVVPPVAIHVEFTDKVVAPAQLSLEVCPKTSSLPKENSKREKNNNL